MRGGFDISGGVMWLPGSGPSPTFGLSARIGVQINHYFSIVYQNMPLVTFTAQEQMMSLAGIASLGSTVSYKAGFADYNILMPMVTLFHMLDIGAGPSLDFLAVSSGSANVTNGSSNAAASGVSPGLHGRIAFNIGGLSGNGPRRSGFNIGVDAHPIFTSAGFAFSVTGGIGGEWY